ncbi:MAG TPA: [LysW]-aminoadipate kinase [Anaerolineae bacterium]|nr:[LysW]-aminoadipate kinase [Anaerolineae bacterium]
MIIVKIGGGKDLNHDAICADVAALLAEGEQMVLIHGGSELTNEIATQLGHPPEFVTSVSGHVSRRTDRRMLEIFEMVYCGLVNKGLVERLQQLGVNAVGLSGLDGRLLEGRRKATLRIRREGRTLLLRDDYTGTVDRVNTALLRLLLDAGYLPVLTPPAISFGSEAINVDGDRAAAAIAAALGASALVILTSVPGLLQAFPDESTLIRHIPRNQVDEFMAFAQGRMKKKVMAATEALSAGVSQVIFADGRVERPLRQSLAGEGTVIA